MYITLLIFLFISAVMSHEIGHAKKMKDAGILVTEIALGLKYGPSIHFNLSGKWKGTKFSIYYLCPFGGFVECDNDAIESLPFWKRSAICAGGPFASIIVGTMLIVFAGFAAIAERPNISFDYWPHLPYLIPSLAVIIFFGTAFEFGERRFYQYIVPIFPLAATVLLGAQIFISPESMSSVIGVAQVGGQVSDVSGALFYVGGISISGLGIVMLLPFYIFGMPLDGASIVRPLIENLTHMYTAFFDIIATIVPGLLIIYLIQKDLMPFFLHLIR